MKCCSSGSIHSCFVHHRTEIKMIHPLFLIIILTLLGDRPVVLFQSLEWKVRCGETILFLVSV